MKLRLKICLLFWTFFLLLLFVFSTNCYAIKYDFGIEKGDELIWKCNTYNAEELKKVLGKDWNDNLSNSFNNIGRDKKMKWLVKDIIDDDEIYNTETNDYDTILVLEYNKWKWTENGNWEEKKYECKYTYYANPKNYPEDFMFPEFAPFCVPIPFGDYLKKIDLYEGYSIDTRALYAITCEINENDLEGAYPTEYIKIQAMYTNKGILTSYKLYLDDHQVILDITLENDSIFKFDFINSFIPIIIAAIYIGIIYIIYKKILKS